MHLGQLQLPLSEALLTCPAAAFAPSGSCSGVEVRVGEFEEVGEAEAVALPERVEASRPATDLRCCRPTPSTACARAHCRGASCKRDSGWDCAHSAGAA